MDVFRSCKFWDFRDDELSQLLNPIRPPSHLAVAFSLHCGDICVQTYEFQPLNLGKKHQQTFCKCPNAVTSPPSPFALILLKALLSSRFMVEVDYHHHSEMPGSIPRSRMKADYCRFRSGAKPDSICDSRACRIFAKKTQEFLWNFSGISCRSGPKKSYRMFRAVRRFSSKAEHFPGIGKIKYEGPKSKNPLSFRYYDANEVVKVKVGETEISKVGPLRSCTGIDYSHFPLCSCWYCKSFMLITTLFSLAVVLACADD